MNYDRRPGFSGLAIAVMAAGVNSNDRWLVQRVITLAGEEAQASLDSTTLFLKLARLADAQLRDWFKDGEIPSVTVRLPALPAIPGVTVTNTGSVAARVRIEFAAEVSNRPAERQSTDYQLAAVLLCIIAWMVYFVGPQMIAKQPSAEQATMNDYWSLVPGVALVLTGYIIARYKRM